MVIDGSHISPEDLVRVARDSEKVILSPKIKSRIKKCRSIVDSIVLNKEMVYGITTGFGAFKNKVIDQSQTQDLQRNLILSHAVGVGKPLSTEIVRGIMFLIVNYLSKGYSGATLKTIETFVQMLNKSVHPVVPEKGSVGSSGDLAPSAHVALVLIGQGEAEYRGRIMSGDRAMSLAGIEPVVLSSKEGLAIINNTSTMSSIASLAIHDADMVVKIADLCGALSLQAIMGTSKAYDQRIHQLKPHDGQIDTANRLRELLDGSKMIDNSRTQEAYSFRCIPQIHGAVREALNYVRRVVTTEINSVTDNPLIFDGKTPEAISGGNFHGEPVAIAMDTLGIALSEIANTSDRRIATLFDPSTSNGLPAFLVVNGGLNSGLMITQYTTASLVSENKILAHPASVDSIPTSANVEDLVSMGTIAARKAREILGNVRFVLSIELLASCQAIDIRIEKDPTRKLSPKSLMVYKFVRKIVPFFKKDDVYYPYINKIENSLNKLTR